MRIGFASKPKKYGPWTSNTDMLTSIRRLENMIEVVLVPLSIDIYRITSSLIPRIRHGSDAETFDDSQVFANRTALAMLGDYYKKKDIRTLMHTTLFSTPNSNDLDVVEETKREFEIFSYVCDALSNDSFLEFTPGVVYRGQSRAEAFARSVQFLDGLDENVIKNLVIENTGGEEYIGNIEECIALVDRFGIRMDVDFKHVLMSSLEIKKWGTAKQALIEALYCSVNSWEGKGTPIIHWGDITTKKDSVSEFVDSALFYQIVSGIGFEVDAILETKQREFDVVKLRQFSQSNDTFT